MAKKKIQLSEIEPLVISDIAVKAKKVLPFLGDDPNFPILSGMHINGYDGNVDFVGMSGAILKVIVAEYDGQPFSVTIPREAVRELQKFPGSDTLLTFSNMDCAFTSVKSMGNIRHGTKYQYGIYPDYNAILDRCYSVIDSGAVSAEVDRKALLAAITRLGVIVASGDKFKLHYAGRNQLGLTVASAAQIKGAAIVPGTSSGSVSFTLNKDLMAAVFRSIDADTVTLRSNATGLSPIMIDGDGDTTMLMPMEG